MSTTTSNALSQVLAFARRFGEPHVALAMHAAVPLGLTPELVHLLRINFVCHADWIAEADLLLSALCRPSGGELYEMEPSARRLLLEELEQDMEFTRARVREVAEFLEIYVDHARPESREMRAFLQALRWGARAELDPAATARELAEALRTGVDKGDTTEALRIAEITDALSGPLLGEEALLVYAAELREALSPGEMGVGATRSGTVVHGVELPPIGAPAPLEKGKLSVERATGEWRRIVAISEELRVYLIARKGLVAFRLGGQPLRFEGRWHESGTRVVYCADSLTAALADFVVDPSSAADCEGLELRIPRSTSIEMIPNRPGLLGREGSAQRRALVREWITSGSSLALAVPSARVAGAMNYLLNPEHPDFNLVSPHVIPNSELLSVLSRAVDGLRKPDEPFFSPEEA